MTIFQRRQANADLRSQGEEQKQKLNRLLKNSQRVLLITRTTFPFTLFPNKLVITLSDVSVVFSQFFFAKEMRSIPITKIAEVIVDTGLFFGKLRLIDKDFSQITVELEYLPLSKALRAKRLIQGLLFASKEGVDLTKIRDDNLISKIEELGRVQSENMDYSQT